MNKYKHIIAFDLSSYGAALAIINQFVDDEGVKVFEISPCGTSAILILLAQEINLAQLLKSEIISFFKAQVLNAHVVENIHCDLLPTYLSQNKALLQKNLLVLEGNSIATGLRLADRILKDKHALVDFRVVRTFPKNVILSITTENNIQCLDLDISDFRKTYIEGVQPVLKSYYEV